MDTLIIQTENIMEKLWTRLSFFMNEVQVKELLYQSYILEALGEQDARRLAFENTHKFIYFLKQGVSYFRVAENSELIVKPLLQYYGMTSLMKSVILMHDPLYPKTTTVLQHGITTRKRKKADYVLAYDEIKIQRDGLLPHFAQVVLNESLAIHQKYNIKELLSVIPEFQDAYQLIFKEVSLIPVQVESNIEKLNPQKHYCLKITLRQKEHQQELFNQCQLVMESAIKKQEAFNNIVLETNIDTQTLQLYSPVKFDGIHFQLFRRDIYGNLFLYIEDLDLHFDEIVVMNMINYFLSMLCRYDTELWGEILFSFSSTDLYLITEYLNISIRKFPNLILNHFFEKQIIFTT